MKAADCIDLYDAKVRIATSNFGTMTVFGDTERSDTGYIIEGENIAKLLGALNIDFHAEEKISVGGSRYKSFEGLEIYENRFGEQSCDVIYVDEKDNGKLTILMIWINDDGEEAKLLVSYYGRYAIAWNDSEAS